LSPSIPRGQRRQAGESHPKTGVSQADCNDCCFHDPLPLNGLGFDLTLQQDCFQCDFLNVVAAGSYSPFPVLHKNLKALAILAGFVVLANWSAAAASCCGNVGTRVLCGFPSSEGNARTLHSVSRFSALGASFPQQALGFVAFRTGCICEPVIRLKCTPFSKPRRMRTSPDSCTEPFFQ
jgi:hypothetical protein